MILSTLRAALIPFVLTPMICLQAQTEKTQAPAPAQKGQKAASPKPAEKPSEPSPFDKYKSFSATLNGGVAMDHDRKIYRSGDFLRADFEDHYSITNVQKGAMWGMNSKSCQYVALPDAASYPFSAYRDFRAERALTEEKETVDGHPCKIENVTFKPTDDRPFVIKMKLWEAEDLDGFPVRIEIDATGRKLPPITYSNVSLEPPDPKLFQHPANCKAGPRPGEKGTIGFTPDRGTPKTPPKTPKQ